MTKLYNISVLDSNSLVEFELRMCVSPKGENLARAFKSFEHLVLCRASERIKGDGQTWLSISGLVRYTEIKELGAELLNLFIEKIEIGERAERYSRTTEQEIIIHY